MTTTDRTLRLLAFVGLLALLLVACGPGPATDNGEPPSESENAAEEVAAEETDQESAEATAEPVEEVAQSPTEEGGGEGEESAAPSDSDFDMYGEAGEEEYTTTNTGLRYVIFEAGDGPSPAAGEIVSVHYTGWLVDGTQFDSSVDRGQPFSFPLGMGRVIPGWDEGIALMNVGDKGRLIIPSELAYGPNGSGSIPPDSTLVFDVELLGIQPGPPEAPTVVDPDEFTTTEQGVQIADLEEGDGPVVQEGDLMGVEFTIWLDDGTLLDSTLLRGRPVEFILGRGQFVPGWDESFEGMKSGGVRQMVFPAEAFNAGGANLPESSSVIIEVEIQYAE